MCRRMAHFQTYRGNLLVCVENRTQTQEPLADSTKNNLLLGECVRRTKSALNSTWVREVQNATKRCVPRENEVKPREESTAVRESSKKQASRCKLSVSLALR